MRATVDVVTTEVMSFTFISGNFAMWGSLHKRADSSIDSIHSKLTKKTKSFSFWSEFSKGVARWGVSVLWTQYGHSMVTAVVGAIINCIHLKLLTRHGHEWLLNSCAFLCYSEGQN